MTDSEKLIIAIRALDDIVAAYYITESNGNEIPLESFRNLKEMAVDCLEEII